MSAGGCGQNNFYPRSPCGERRTTHSSARTSSLFLSTFPLRGTSSLPHDAHCAQRHFYPRSPCGERLAFRLSYLPQPVISIHVPLAGNVPIQSFAAMAPSAFLSTFPLRGTSLSIALRMFEPLNFYPRSPCGERRFFLSNPPPFLLISIHVPLAGNVCAGRGRLPAGRVISIHVPLAGNVQHNVSHASGAQRFLSTFPLRGTSVTMSASAKSDRDFYPRSPCGERPDHPRCFS